VMLWWEAWKARKHKAPVAAPVSSENAISTGAGVGSAGVTPQMLTAAGISTKPRKKGK